MTSTTTRTRRTSAQTPRRRPGLGASGLCLLFLIGTAGLWEPALAFLPSEPGRVRLDLPSRPAPEISPQRRALELESREAGRWTLEWDPWSGAAALGMRGTPPATAGTAAQTAVLAAAEAFLARHASLLGARCMPLARVRCEHLGRAWYVTWQQQDGGRDVLACNLTLVISESGVPIAFRSTLVPGLRAKPAAFTAARDVARAAAERTGEELVVESSRPVVVAVPGSDGYAAVAADQVELRGRSGWRWEALAEAGTGQLLALESRIRTFGVDGTVHAELQPQYAQDAPVVRPLQWLNVSLTAGSTGLTTTGNAQGVFFFDVPAAGNCTVEAGLAGLYVYVVNQAGSPAAHATTGASAPGSAGLHFGSAEARLDERTIYYHTNVIHDFARTHFNFTLLDFPMRATAAVVNPVNGNPDYANAFWDGIGINFGNGGQSYFNFGLFADVIYHEYVHGMTDFMYQSGGGLGGAEGGAIHEALSDYFACTITNEPLVGEGISGSGFYFRNLENTLRWPENAVGEVHGDGEILGGALWDLRRLVGAQVADAVIHFARTLYPRTFEDYAIAVQLQDDVLFGDGAPGNGSPHLNEIATAFAIHGIGDGATRTRQLVHEPLLDTENAGVPRNVRVAFDFGISTPLDSLLLQWSTSGPFHVVRMPRQADGSFVGQIPGQAEGTDVRYWMTTKPRRGQATLILPPGAPAVTYGYHVGPDNQPPVVTHVPRSAAAACSWPAELGMDIDDNLGVASAYVEYLQNGVPCAKVGLVRRAGEQHRFTTQFQNVGGAGDEIEYWIVVQDASRAGNTVRVPASGGYHFQIGSNLAEDFESGGPWSHRKIVVTHGDPWHVSDTSNHTPGGARAWQCGTEGSEYPPIVAAELLTDTYSLGIGAQASVWSRLDAETNGPFAAFDGGIVQVQVDGDPGWQTLVPAGGYAYHMSDTGGTNVLEPGTPCLSGHDADWRKLQFDLAAWSRKRVRLRFLFGSDNVPSPSGTLQGWMLDDFTLDPGLQDPTDVAGLPAGPGTALLARPPGPNPGRPQITFALRVPSGAGHVRLDLFDVRGRRVRRLLDTALPLGARDILWDGRTDTERELPSGVYTYRLESQLGIERGRIVVLR